MDGERPEIKIMAAELVPLVSVWNILEAGTLVPRISPVGRDVEMLRHRFHIHGLVVGTNRDCGDLLDRQFRPFPRQGTIVRLIYTRRRGYEQRSVLFGERIDLDVVKY